MKMMACYHTTHIPIYEGDEDLRKRWFICERIWDGIDIIDDAKQVAQFVGAQ